MEFDEIIVGSGLVGLAVALGLPPQRRVLVLGGPARGQHARYAGAIPVPSAYHGIGGLGNYWHGVIPFGGRHNFCGNSREQFATLFNYFYPRTEVAERWGKSWLFVPWNPIRPAPEWRRLQARRGHNLRVVQQSALAFEMCADGVAVRSETASYRGARIWICAGTLRTPGLLDRSLGLRVSRDLVSDHFICYLGQIDRAAHPDEHAPRVQRTRDGVWFEAQYDGAETALITRKPARFEFRRLDHGIEARAVFGLPTGSAFAKIARAGSPGLIAEALYNRAGLFPNAKVQNVYAQIVVPDAHTFSPETGELLLRDDVISTTTIRARERLDWPHLRPSRRPDLFIPGIHLHHSVNLPALHSIAANQPASRLQVVDGAVHADIGPDHHSFKVMVAAATLAGNVPALR